MMSLVDEMRIIGEIYPNDSLLEMIEQKQMVFLRVPPGATSYSDTVMCCRLSDALRIGVVREILGKDRFFVPGMNPREVYRYNDGLIGLEAVMEVG